MSSGTTNGNSEKAFEEVATWIESAIARPPFLLGIGGPGGCGKTTLTAWLLNRLSGSVELPLDDFRLPREQRGPGIFGSHPDGNDLDGLRACLRAAREGRGFERPTFDRATGNRGESIAMPPSRVLICDGEIAAHASLRREFDALVVVEAHWRTQLNTRLTRDLQERQCGLEKAIHIFLQSNLRDYSEYANGAKEAAAFVLYRNRHHNFSIKKRPAIE